MESDSVFSVPLCFKFCAMNSGSYFGHIPYSRKLIPGSVLEGPFVRCPEAGHMSPLENPEPVNQAIRGFVSRL
jgi:pimeloyl-ACP methyl ester carboxylesterase